MCFIAELFRTYGVLRVLRGLVLERFTSGLAASRGAKGMLRCLVRWMAVVLWMGGIFLLSAIPSLELPAASAYAAYDHPLRKFAHVLEYTGLTLLLYRAF